MPLLPSPSSSTHTTGLSPLDSALDGCALGPIFSAVLTLPSVPASGPTAQMAPCTLGSFRTDCSAHTWSAEVVDRGVTFKRLLSCTIFVCSPNTLNSQPPAYPQKLYLLPQISKGTPCPPSPRSPKLYLFTQSNRGTSCPRSLLLTHSCYCFPKAPGAPHVLPAPWIPSQAVPAPPKHQGLPLSSQPLLTPKSCT